MYRSRLRRSAAFVVEQLEQRRLLDAAVVGPTSVPFSGTAPLAPQPGKTFWINGNGTSNPWQWNSAITPNTVNDLVLNVTAFAQSYTPCCEANDDSPYVTAGAIGTTGSINAGRLLTNGLTQNQVGDFPSSGQAPATGSGGISDAPSPMSVLSDDNTPSDWWLEYNLGNSGNFNGSGYVTGTTPNTAGYDITEIDVIAGQMQADIQVQFANGNTTDWFTLSNGANFTFTQDQNGNPLGRGSAQMAIVNSGQGSLIATHVRAVKFVATNDDSFRELVVTGIPSTGVLPSSVAPAPVAALDPSPPAGVVDVSYTVPIQPNMDAQDSTTYILKRAQVINGVIGTFITIPGSGVFKQSGSVTFYDTTASAGQNTYIYRVVANSPAGSTSGPSSAPITTPAMAAELHAYNEAFWTGPVFASQGLAQASISSASGSWGPGIGNSQDGVIITGKVTTNAAGVYTFISNTDDDGYLYVDGALVGDDPGVHGPRNAGMQNDINNVPIGTANPITLAANTSYDFVLMEHNSEGSAAASMLWIPPGSSTPVLVPAANLSPVSDPPAQPLDFTAAISNSNFVNFTFTADNSGVIGYILQRKDVSAGVANQPWVTVGQSWPAGNTVARAGQFGSGAITSVSPAHVTIQDAMPIPGNTYLYRVAAMNYDGAVSSPQTPPMVATAADSAGLVPGTYFVAYTWLGDNTNATGETQIGAIGNAASTETTIVLTNTTDLLISNFGATPPNAQNVNVYIGTAGGGEKLISAVSPNATLTVHTLSTPVNIPIPASNTTGRLSAPTGAVSISPMSASLISGAEIHMYNGRLTDGQLATQFQMAMNGIPAEYRPQTTNMSLGSFLPGVIDRDYDFQMNEVVGGYFPPTPDYLNFPDIPRIEYEDYAQIFTGKLQVGLSGPYTIISNTDDSGFVWLNGTLVSADPGTHDQQDTISSRAGDTLVPVILQPGQSYNLTMEMSNKGGGAGAHLKWIEPRVLDNFNVASSSGLFNSSANESTVTLNMSSEPSFSLTGYSLYITSGTGAGQNANIASWNSTSKVAMVNVTDNGSNLLWTTLPDTTSGYAVALYEPIPLAGQDNTNGNTAGGLSLRQDPPVQSSWNPLTGAVGSTSAGSAAGNLAVAAIDSRSGVTLTWTDQSNSELWFEVQRSTDNANWTTVGTTPFDIGTSFTDPTAGNAFNSSTVSYFYRVRGVNFDAAGPFSTVISTASYPPPMQLDTINGTSGADQITLLQDRDRAHIDWTLNGSPIAQLLINDPQGLTINGNGGSDVITLDYSAGNPLPATLHLNGTFFFIGLQGANTNIEIGRSTVFIRYSSSDPVSLIQGYLRNGYNNGGWNGVPTADTGVITSLPAAQNAMQTTGIGYADWADFMVAQPVNTIELKYTLYGDTSLKGTVGSNDFTRLTLHYHQTTGGAWDTGDFNYDGSVNFNDLTLLTRTYNTTLASQAVPAVNSVTTTGNSGSSIPISTSNGPPTVQAKPPPQPATRHHRPRKQSRKHR